MNSIFTENLALENKKAGITSTAVHKAVKAVSDVAGTLQVKVASTTNSLGGGLYALNGVVRIKVKASYKGGEREFTVPISVKNGIVCEANKELISDKLKSVAKKELGTFTDIIRNIKRADIEDYINVEKDFYNNNKNIDDMETLEDGTMFNPNGWTSYNESESGYLMIYKGKGAVEKGIGDVPFIAVDLEDGKEIGTANTIMQARKIVEDFVNDYYAEASKQAERKMFFVEAGKAIERKATKYGVGDVIRFRTITDSLPNGEQSSLPEEEIELEGEIISIDEGTSEDSEWGYMVSTNKGLVATNENEVIELIKKASIKECDYLNNVLVYASTSENAIKLASDFNDGKIEVEEVEFNGKKIAAVVEKQEKKAYKYIDSAAYEVIVTVTCDSEEEATKIRKGLSNSYPEVIKNGVEVSVYLDEYSTDLAQSTIENELNELGFHIEASKIKALNKQAKEVTINNGGSNANLPKGVESGIISYSKAHLPDDLEEGDEVNLSGKKWKVESKISNGQVSATEWNLKEIKE